MVVFKVYMRKFCWEGGCLSSVQLFGENEFGVSAGADCHAEERRSQ